MLKIVSGKNYVCEGAEEKFLLSSDCAQLIFVTEGFAFFDKQRIDCSQGYVTLDESEIWVRLGDNAPCSFFRFELDGTNDTDAQKLLERTGLSAPTASFSVFSPEKAKAILTSLCGDGYESHSEAFDEAAAMLLLSLVNATDSARLYGNPYVDGAVKYINANIDKEIKVEELARMLGTDRMYLRNLFVKHAGVSTMEYIMNTRVERAKELLKNKRLAIKEIAARVGYSDVLCFSKAFKKHVGVSPSEYRDDLKAEVAKKKSERQQVPVYIL